MSHIQYINPYNIAY